MNWVSDNIFTVSSTNGMAAAAVQLVNSRDQTYGPAATPLYTAEQHVRWGELDNQPNTFTKLLEKNGQVQATLDTHRDFLFGKGLVFKRKITEGNKVLGVEEYFDPRLEDLADDHRLNHFYMGEIVNLMTNGNAFVRAEWATDRTEFRLSNSDPFFTRIGKPTKHGITEYHYNPYFGDSYYQLRKYDSDVIPAYSKDKLVSMMHVRPPRSGNPFYGFPSWWATEDWIELANLIAIFHKQGLLNGYNFKYLIKMPKDYFDSEGGRELSSKEVQARWNKFSDNLRKWMSGTEGVNKSMIVKYVRGDDGKALDSIDVVSIKNEMGDDAYGRVWEMANLSIANAAGILPTLAGVNPGKGNDSGSQIRVMADFQQHFRTAATREILLEPVKHWLRNNGFSRDIFPDVNAIQITTLDVAATGTQPVTTSSTTEK